MMDSNITFEDICLDNLVPDHKYGIDILTTRIAENDSLVQSYHSQAQELQQLRHQLTSLNNSSIQVNTFFLEEKQRSERIQLELDEAKLSIGQLQRELAESRHAQLNEASIHTQVVADLESKHDTEIISLCKQYLLVGNLLADNHLSDGAINRTYMKVVEMLKRKGQSVDGLLKTTSAKKKKPKTVGTMTDPMPPQPAQPKVTVDMVTMTDTPPRKIFCNRSVQHHPTTTTRGTTTSVFIQKISIGTNFPEPVSLDEIFRQAIIEIPSPLSPILDFKWPTVDSGCQTTTTDDAAIPPNATTLYPPRHNIQLNSVGTITELSNVMKRIGYTKPLQEQLVSNRNSLGAIYRIKKEDSSPAGSMNNLASLGANNVQSFPPTADVLPGTQISPQLSSLWSILGQTIFSIIGTGQIFENSPSALDMINLNLNHIRRLMEGDLDGDSSEIPSPDDTRTTGDESRSSTTCVQTDDDVNYEEECDMPSGSDLSSSPPMIIPSHPSIRVVSQTIISAPTTGSDSTRSEISTISQTPQSTATFISPLRPTLPQQPTATPQLDDNVIFKKPTSAVRRLSPSQRAKAMANKKPIISPSSYSIDRNFKRARRKQQLSLAELAHNSHEHQHRRSSKQHRQPGATLKAEPDASTVKRQRLNESGDFSGGNDNRYLNGIDAWSISQQFKAPVFIEPIIDLDNIDLIGPMSCGEISECAENLTSSEVPLMAAQTLFSDGYYSTESDCDAEQSMVAELMDLSSDSDDDDSVSESCASPESPAKGLKAASPTPPATSPPALEDYDSPASPTNQELPPKCTQIPAIPLETLVSTIQPISKQAITFVTSRPRLTTAAAQPNATIFLKVFKIVNHFLDEPDCLESTLSQCSMHILTATKSFKLIATCLLEITEDIDEPYLSTSIGPIPSLSESHKRLVLLVKRIDTLMPGFLEYSLLSVERSLFTFKNNDMKIEAIVNLTRLFSTMCDLRTNVTNSRVRLFLYKCLYYFNHKSTPMVYTVLMTNPDCLPLLPESELMTQFPATEFNKFDPLVQTVYTILMHCSYQCASTTLKTHYDTECYKKPELVFLLKSYYRFTGIKYHFEHLLAHLFERIDRDEVYNVEYALILLAKRKGVVWAKQHIMGENALPAHLRRYVQLAGDTDAHDDKIATVLTVIAAVVKTYPVTEDITGVHDLLAWTLATVPDDRQVLQEATIAAFFMTSRFGADNVFRRIRHWTPPFDISRKLKTQWQTFVNRKSPGWQKSNEHEQQ